MANKITLSKQLELHGITYQEGSSISVSNSLFEMLSQEGYVKNTDTEAIAEAKQKSKKEKAEEVA
jgi:glycerol-3-phosphate O-acyltransferase